jgi:hypothetical protein
VLDEDNATLLYLFGGNVTASVTRKVFQPDGNLNARETPIAFQLPDWNRWLPQVHPLDAWGESFSSSEFYRLYGGAGSKTSLRTLLAAPDLGERVSSGKVAGYFEKWQEARRRLLKPYVAGRKVNWSRELSVKAYSTQLWQLVKTWELMQAFQLEDRGRELFGETADATHVVEHDSGGDGASRCEYPGQSGRHGGQRAD